MLSNKFVVFDLYILSFNTCRTFKFTTTISPSYSTTKHTQLSVCCNCTCFVYCASECLNIQKWGVMRCHVSGTDDFHVLQLTYNKLFSLSSMDNKHNHWALPVTVTYEYATCVATSLCLRYISELALTGKIVRINVWREMSEFSIQLTNYIRR